MGNTDRVRKYRTKVWAIFALAALVTVSLAAADRETPLIGRYFDEGPSLLRHIANWMRGVGQPPRVIIYLPPPMVPRPESVEAAPPVTQPADEPAFPTQAPQMGDLAPEVTGAKSEGPEEPPAGPGGKGMGEGEGRAKGSVSDDAVNGEEPEKAMPVEAVIPPVPELEPKVREPEKFTEGDTAASQAGKELPEDETPLAEAKNQTLDSIAPANGSLGGAIIEIEESLAPALDPALDNEQAALPAGDSEQAACTDSVMAAPPMTKAEKPQAEDLAVTPPPAEAKPPRYETGQVVYITRRSNLRCQPGPDAKILVKLRRGEPVRIVVGRTRLGYYRVRHPSAMGWVWWRNVNHPSGSGGLGNEGPAGPGKTTAETKEEAGTAPSMPDLPPPASTGPASTGPGSTEEESRGESAGDTGMPSVSSGEGGDENLEPTQAARGGDPEAQYKLGMVFFTGDGVGQDFAAAARWFRLAARQDHSAAQYYLGLLHYKGRGVSRDFLQAYMWIDRSAAQGDFKALQARKVMRERLPESLFN